MRYYIRGTLYPTNTLIQKGRLPPEAT
jgi:hypothetical protein